MILRRWVWAVLLGLAAGGAAGAPRWSVYQNCRLIDNDFNDGDSFHARCGRRHYILRLYFVDAPETDAAFPERVKEQAAYFDIDGRALLKTGKMAAASSMKFLKDGFTVYTKREDAQGQSARPRYFAMIKVGDRWLSDMLVEEGLARIYGAPTELPDGVSSRKYKATLRVKEREARRQKKGAWGLTKGGRVSGPDASSH